MNSGSKADLQNLYKFKLKLHIISNVLYLITKVINHKKENAASDFSHPNACKASSLGKYVSNITSRLQILFYI